MFSGVRMSCGEPTAWMRSLSWQSTCWANSCIVAKSCENFTYRYAGRDFRLTDVHGKVVKAILA